MAELVLCARVLLGPVHEACPMAFDLMRGRNSTESNLAEACARSSRESTVSDSTYALVVGGVDNSDGAMPALKNQPGDVLLWHVGQLL